MQLHTQLKSLLRTLFGKAELDRELDEELTSYLEMLAEERIRSGVRPAQAYREARLELGGMEQVKEQVRERRLGFALDTLLQDVRYTLRTCGKNLGFTVVAVLILAIGIGANTALFSNIQTALLRDIHYPEADRLVAGLKTWDGVVAGSVSAVDYYDYQELNTSFEGLAATSNFTTQHMVLGGERPELVDACHATWNLFSVLGVIPAAGRLITSEDVPRDAAHPWAALRDGAPRRSGLHGSDCLSGAGHDPGLFPPGVAGHPNGRGGGASDRVREGTLRLLPDQSGGGWWGVRGLT